MTSSNSAKTDTLNEYMEASEAIDGTLEERKEQFRRDREAMEVTEKALEEKYADRGLKFTVGIRGAMPVQAFGVIDGMRFYFRFRRDTLALQVGDLDPETPQRDHERDVKLSTERLARLEEKLATGEISEDDISLERALYNRAIRRGPQFPNGKDDYPTIVKKLAVINEYTGEPYNGFLDSESAFKAFSRCVDELNDVDFDLDAEYEKARAILEQRKS